MKNTLMILGLALAGILLSCCGPSKEEITNYDTVISEEMDVSENSEEYAHVEETGFMSVSKHPFSTFSIDVDAASYTNVRRMLQDGQLPPADAVRVEEWINYFTYTYPQPLGNDPFRITTEYGDCPWNGEHKLLQIGLKGKEIPAEKTVPNNLVFLIDASGSMEEPDKLPLLKRAFTLLLPQLKDEDRISIVTYAGSAGRVLENASPEDREKIMTALENLKAGGSTAGGEGINLAYAVAKENYIKKGNNRIILATDGDFNVGVSSQAELEKLIEETREEGIYLSVLGFGTGNIKDNTMELLADKGNGNYNYIDNFMEARKVLVKQFGGTLQTIAKDVKLQVEFNPAYIKEYRLIGYYNRRLNDADFNDDKKDAGELGAGHTVTALYEIVISGSAEDHSKTDAPKYQKNQALSVGGEEMATIKFRFKNPAKNDTVSRLMIHPVLYRKPGSREISDNFKLASAVSEFGLIMKDSEFKSAASFDKAIARAEAVRIKDEEGYVHELIQLMKVAKDLKGQAAVAEK